MTDPKHDPLCPVFKYPGQICECFFIGKARADERERRQVARMSDHPCPLPRKRRWLRGRRWTCACGRKYWLLEADDAGTYYDNLRFLDDGPDWQWVEADALRAGSAQ